MRGFVSRLYGSFGQVQKNMTEDDDQQSREDAARLRIAEITDLFAEMRALMTKWRRDAGPAADANTKQMMNKVNELQGAHLALLRAEEVFHEKFGQGDIEDGIDYEAARYDIGCELDRLRTAMEARFVSRRADDSAD